MAARPKRVQGRRRVRPVSERSAMLRNISSLSPIEIIDLSGTRLGAAAKRGVVSRIDTIFGLARQERFSLDRITRTELLAVRQKLSR